MNNISFSHELYDNCIVIKFDWEFTNENAISIFDDVSKIRADNKKGNIIFNMQNIDTINSRAAWWFARIYEESDTLWWTVYVSNMNVFIEDTLDLLWMFLFLEKSKTQELALEEINIKWA